MVDEELFSIVKLLLQNQKKNTKKTANELLA